MNEDEWPSLDAIAAIARSALYEGFILWPYRRSALKNQQRWTFGGIFPEAYVREGHSDDASAMSTECLVEADGQGQVLATVRFLHVAERCVGRMLGDTLEVVDALHIAGQDYSTWDDAIECEGTVGPLDLTERPTRIVVPIEIPMGSDREYLEDRGKIAGLVERRWEEIVATVEMVAEPVLPRVWKIRVEIVNGSPWSGQSREQALRRTMVSTHTLLRARNAAFVSQIDPPAELVAVARSCTSRGCFPVLAGRAQRDVMLSSPIILYDFPEVAAASPGDFFDGGEIDQLLVLNVLSLTDAEQRAMRETDPRTAKILERCLDLTPEDFLRLHGVTRELTRQDTAR